MTVFLPLTVIVFGLPSIVFSLFVWCNVTSVKRFPAILEAAVIPIYCIIIFDWDICHYSDVVVYTEVNCSNASQKGTQQDNAWTHFIKVLSVIPGPWIIPQVIFTILIKTEDKFPAHKSLSQLIVKYPLFEKTCSHQMAWLYRYFPSSGGSLPDFV